MDKKINLEHTIRNIVRESVGVTGKDKPEGTSRSFLKPVGVISPPKGEEHPGTKKTATILAQRGEDKVQHGLKVEETIEEEIIDEASLKSIANTAYNIGRNVGDITTYGGLDYLGATRDYLTKNIGSMIGLSNPTTFSKELAHEKEKTKKAEDALPSTIKFGVKTVKAGQEGFMAGAGKQEVKAGIDYLGKKITGDDKEKWGGLGKEIGKLGTEYAQELEKGQKAYEYAPKTYTGAEVGGTASALVGVPLALARGTVGAARLGAKYGPKLVGATGKEILPKTAATLKAVDRTLPTAAGVSATTGHALTADETGQSEVRKATNKALEKTLEPIVSATKPLLKKGIEKFSEYEKKKQIKEGAAEDLFKAFKGAAKSADDLAKEFKSGKITLKDIDAQLKYMSPGPERAQIEKLRNSLGAEQSAKPAPKGPAPGKTEPGREGTPVRRDNDNVPPRRDDKVVPIRRSEPGEWPAPYKPGKDFPNLPPPANPTPGAPKITPKRVRPDDFPPPGQDPFRVSPPVKTPEAPKPQRPPDKDPFKVTPQRTPDKDPFEVKPKAPPTELPKKLEPPPYTSPKLPSPAARPVVAPGAFPAAKPKPASTPNQPAAVPQPAAQPAPANKKAAGQNLGIVKEPAKNAEPVARPVAAKKESAKKTGETPPRRRTPFSFPFINIDGSPLSGPSGAARGSSYTHTTRQYIKRERVDESADEERRSIENVARPKSDRKKAVKQAEIIRKIIEEKKATRKKSTATVDMNPKIKTPEADQ